MRARINERLARAARFPVTLLVAPAGFGKSVALRDFIETSRLDAVRYDVRREDRTLLAFVRGLSEALEPLAPSALAAYPAVGQRVLAAGDPVGELAAWFGEHLRRAVGTVVVDDLHHAAADPASPALLAELVERTRGRIAWIIASRSDAGLPVASWLGYGHMDLPIGEDDLRFTADEALAAAAQAHASVDPGEVEELRRLAEGWPVALAIALRTRLHASDLRAATTGTREMVSRYLAEQVYGRLSIGQQRFLLATCFFSTFDLALAEACGADAAFLTDLRNDVAFLTMLTPSTFRYHDLFRDFLEREVRRSGARRWFEALVAAAQLLEQRGDDADALALYTRAGANDAILALVRRDGFGMFERGAGETLAAALDAVPEQMRRDDAAALGLSAAIAASRGRFEIAEGEFATAIARAADRDLRITLVARYALELVRHDRDSIALLEPYAHDETIPAAARIPLVGTLGTAYVRAGRIDDALATIARALEDVDALDDAGRARLYQQAAYVHQFAPGRGHARSYASLAVDLALRCSLYEVAARAYSLLYTVVNDEDDDPIASLAILDKLGENARKGASRQARAFGVIASYAIEVERGDDAALARLDGEVDAATDVLPRARAETLLPALALRAAWEGDFRTAHALLAGSAAAQGSAERRALRAAEIALYALAAGLRDEGHAALTETNEALSGCTQPTRRLARARLVAALAELTRGHASAAHRHLAEAQRLATPAMRTIRALAQAVDALRRVAIAQADPPLVAAALERLRAEHYGGLARLLAAIPFPHGDEPGYAQLTPAEREILQLLASGASSKGVAERTGRSAQTVDTHIRSICRKLRCSGRREAIAVALGAGWIQLPS